MSRRGRRERDARAATQPPAVTSRAPSAPVDPTVLLPNKLTVPVEQPMTSSTPPDAPPLSTTTTPDASESFVHAIGPEGTDAGDPPDASMQEMQETDTAGEVTTLVVDPAQSAAPDVEITVTPGAPVVPREQFDALQLELKRAEARSADDAASLADARATIEQLREQLVTLNREHQGAVDGERHARSQCEVAEQEAARLRAELAKLRKTAAAPAVNGKPAAAKPASSKPAETPIHKRPPHDVRVRAIGRIAMPRGDMTHNQEANVRSTDLEGLKEGVHFVVVR